MQTIRTVRTVELPDRLIACFPLSLTDAIRRCGASCAEEIRLHRNRICTVTCNGQNYPTNIIPNEATVNEILHRLCGGSLYAYRTTINNGYLTLDGGIRVGICGSAAMEDDRVIGVNEITGLIIRIPHRHRVNATPILEELQKMHGTRGILIYSPPGVGKTTLLRTVALEAASGAYAKRTVVVDTREELGHTLDGKNLTLDILIGYPREKGIEIAVRSLGAELIICDEIGGSQDARAILSAANCGVPLIASAHADSIHTLLRRPSLQLLHRAEVFGAYVGIKRDPQNGFQFQITRHHAIHA
jgi:stage III sporulation protein AA